MKKCVVKNFVKAEKALLIGGCLTALLPTHAVFAQSATGSVSVLEEIVVTAQRRQENMQDVPIAVTAICR